MVVVRFGWLDVEVMLDFEKVLVVVDGELTTALGGGGGSGVDGPG